MLKFLLIALLIGFIFFRTIGLLMRLLTGSSVGNRTRSNPFEQNESRAKPKSGNVNIDYVPNKNGKKKNTRFNGGEYVDFEEVE
jgi:hypothetical protein